MPASGGGAVSIASVMTSAGAVMAAANVGVARGAAVGVTPSGAGALTVRLAAGAGVKRQPNAATANVNQITTSNPKHLQPVCILPPCQVRFLR
ncbi:MAG: hypothetical protein Fur0021_22180 [Candidatus Promineifilaceae bacterium]